MTSIDNIPAPYEFRRGDSPLLISMPHPGTAVPDELRPALTEAALRLPDTDWHVDRLYDFAAEQGANILCARYSRYAVDLNRPPDDTPLYSTATTGLFPDVLFDGEPVYRADARPDDAWRARCLNEIWHPYHECIARTLEQIKARHGYAVLFDAHSIRSVVPRLFDGRLPDFNIGTNEGRSAADDLVARLCAVCEQSEEYTTVLNGRFKGGYITRRYGDPAAGVHAVQLELAQVIYMDESYPFDYLPQRAERVRAVLRRFVETLLAWTP